MVRVEKEIAKLVDKGYIEQWSIFAHKQVESRLIKDNIVATVKLGENKLIVKFIKE